MLILTASSYIMLQKDQLLRRMGESGKKHINRLWQFLWNLTIYLNLLAVVKFKIPYKSSFEQALDNIQLSLVNTSRIGKIDFICVVSSQPINALAIYLKTLAIYFMGIYLF